jgi:hypothetical protein
MKPSCWLSSVESQCSSLAISSYSSLDCTLVLMARLCWSVNAVLYSCSTCLISPPILSSPRLICIHSLLLDDHWLIIVVRGGVIEQFCCFAFGCKVMALEGPAKRNVSFKKQAGAKLNVPAHFADMGRDICWQKTNLLTKKSCFKNLLRKTRSAGSKNLLTESADKNKICWQGTSSDKICVRKE